MGSLFQLRSSVHPWVSAHGDELGHIYLPPQTHVHLQRVQAAGQTLLVGKSAAFLGPGLRTSLGNVLACYGPRTITRYCSCMWVALKPQRVVQGQSKETSGPWDSW